jgi:hypothetical protein
MDALLQKLDTDISREAEHIMSNPKNTAATPKTVKETVEAKSGEEAVIPAQTTEVKPGFADGIKVEDPKDAQSEEKTTLVKRAKAAAEKLKSNKKAMFFLAGAAVVIGLTIKNNRKAVKVEVVDPEDTSVEGVDDVTGPDETDDSL